MSANNAIYIKKKTFEVFYQDCDDNEGPGELIGKGKNLEDAIKIAEKQIKELEGSLEYGIWFTK